MIKLLYCVMQIWPNIQHPFTMSSPVHLVLISDTGKKKQTLILGLKQVHFISKPSHVVRISTR